MYHAILKVGPLTTAVTLGFAAASACMGLWPLVYVPLLLLTIAYVNEEV